METNPDYSNYSYQDLLSAREGIDEKAHPIRTELLDRLIAEHAETKQQIERSNTDKPPVLRNVTAKFNGDAKEYFSIWIVNLLLTIVTLGVYSAWAKVRNNRYLYSCTEIDEHRFSYLAEPKQILKGRVIGVALFGLYYFAASVSPIAGLALALGFILITPFLVCQSLKFKMRMTSYRNIRFSFTGDYWGALKTFTLFPILSIFTLYLAMPWVLKNMDKYILENTTYGDSKFVPELETGEYYSASIVSSLIAVAIGVPLFFLLGLNDFANPDEVESGAAAFNSIALFLSYVFIFTISNSFYTASIRNHIFGNTYLAKVASFSSEVRFDHLMWIRLTNFVALVCTLGLALPWTKVRTLNYLTSCTTVRIRAGADKVVADSQSGHSAVGEEVAGVFDVDIALG